MPDTIASVESYRELLQQTRALYVSSAQQIIREHPELVPTGGDYVELLDDLHRGLVMRVYLMVCKADHHWTAGETQLGVELGDHLWGRRLRGAELNGMLTQAAKKVEELPWETLVRPFAKLAPLRDRAAELETLVVRQSNVVARIDGVVAASELAAIKSIAKQLGKCLALSDGAASDAPEAAIPIATPSPLPGPTPNATQSAAKPPSAAPQRSLEDVMVEIDSLVGLKSAKHELRSLANYIALQQRRATAGLPATEISLHLVFTGNPGTGKTTMARLFGEAMRAMGVLPAGQLIETDRSGLVAEYAGQTGPKTNRKIDEALGGVLFIDEAYSLADADSPDAYGREALQTLLKRAEDDRARLAVVLAGYPDEMTRLLETNPGLASRFSRTLHFDDYDPIELCQIFGRLMDVHHYRLTREARQCVLRTVHDLHACRDRQFGNGRAVRNLFEKAILRMANRLATIAELSEEGLVTFEADDIPWDASLGDPHTLIQVRIACPSCALTKTADANVLGAAVKCPQCGHRFEVEWCEIAAE